MVTLTARHDVPIPCQGRAIRKWLGRLTPEGLFQLLEVKRADAMGQAYETVKDRLDELERTKAAAEEIIAQGQCFCLKDLAVNGRDVLAAGIAPGPEVGRVLDGLLELVLSGGAPNERDVLLRRIQTM